LPLMLSWQRAPLALTAPPCAQIGRLHLNGQLADEYDSCPGYFDDSAEPSGPAGGDAQKLCDAFGASDAAEVERILRKSAIDQDGYAFAVWRHMDLTRVLGIPSSAAGNGYQSIIGGELPGGIDQSDLVKVK
jgi:hypothetical protein